MARTVPRQASHPTSSAGVAWIPETSRELSKNHRDHHHHHHHHRQHQHQFHPNISGCLVQLSQIQVDFPVKCPSQCQGAVVRAAPRTHPASSSGQQVGYQGHPSCRSKLAFKLSFKPWTWKKNSKLPETPSPSPQLLWPCASCGCASVQCPTTLRWMIGWRQGEGANQMEKGESEEYNSYHRKEALNCVGCRRRKKNHWKT